MAQSVFSYKNYTPTIDTTAFIAPTAIIVGDVIIGANSSVWFQSVLRGDVASIRIGNRTNIQDGTVIHVSRNGGDSIIGDDVTIGHKVILHACTLQNKSFVGMGAIILDGAVIETGGMLAAGSLLTSGKIIKAGELWAGSPAKFFRNLTEKEAQFISTSADNYAKLILEYKKI
jgi:carbonic anhydrase/acetyltransferase-like protein (isoleucine patch superfamily)